MTGASVTKIKRIEYPILGLFENRFIYSRLIVLRAPSLEIDLLEGIPESFGEADCRQEETGHYAARASRWARTSAVLCFED